MPGEIWVSAAGLQAGAAEVATLAQDIANVNTAGFKAFLPIDTATAPDAVYPAGLAVGPAAPPQVLAGGGTSPLLSDIDWTQGSVQTTGQPLDVAIIGPGLFALRDSTGATVYTRGGRFQVDGAGQIADAQGRLLLDAQGQPITLPAGALDPQVGSDGTVTARTGGAAPTALGRIGLAFPTAPEGMQPGASGDWLAAPGAGPIRTAAPNGQTVRLQSGALEQSNSDLTVLLPDLLAAERAYQANARAVNTGIQLWDLSNRLRG